MESASITSKLEELFMNTFERIKFPEWQAQNVKKIEDILISYYGGEDKLPTGVKHRLDIGAMLPPLKTGDDLKERQHTVQKAYLENWGADGHVWVRQVNGDIKPRGLRAKVSVGYRFYEVKELNEDEVRFLCFLISGQEDWAAEKLVSYLIANILTPIWFKQYADSIYDAQLKHFGSSSGIPNEVISFIKKIRRQAKLLAINSIEEHHCYFEENGFPQLEMLISGDLGFYHDGIIQDTTQKTDWFRFLQYLWMQMFRTKPMRDRTIRKLGILSSESKTMYQNIGIRQENLRIQNISDHVLFFTALEPVEELWMSKPNLTLITNKTDVNFITSEQPVINLNFDYRNSLEIEPRPILYYPLTPKDAIVINGESCQGKICLTSDEEIDYYNRKIIESQATEFFAFQKSDLQRYFS